MLQISTSPSASLSDLGLLDDKVSSPHFYLRQPHCLQIIQLVEADAPPPRQVSSDLDSSSCASSSYYSSEYSESASSEDDEADDDGEEACSSYCSSDLSPVELAASTSEHSKSSSPESTDTYTLRMKRIHAWREDFYSQLQGTLTESSPPSLKRKLDSLSDGDDNSSHSSKRSRYSQGSSMDYQDSCLMLDDSIGIVRSPASSSPTSTSSSSSSRPSTPPATSSLGMHSCPACDSFFDTPQSLRQHGRDAQANEACCAAVEYAFE